MKTRRSKIALVMAMMVVVNGPALGAPERIGSSYLLEVPAPVGFVRVGQDMPGMLKVHEATQTGSDKVRMLATYIPVADAPAARRDEALELERWCSLQTASVLQDTAVSREQFAQLQQALVAKLREEGEATLAKNPELISRQSDAMGKAAGFAPGQFKMEMGGVAMLAPHDVVEGTHIGMSGFLRLKTDATAAGGIQTDEVLSMTMYMSVAGQRLIQTVCYGAQAELDWTRQATKTWAASIRNANS